MSSWWMRLSSYARPHILGLVVVATLTLVGVALAAVMPWPLKLIVDYFLTGKPLPESIIWIAALPGAAQSNGVLAWLVVGSILLFVAQRTVDISQTYLQTGIGTRMVYRLGEDLFDHLQRLSLRVHSQQRIGDLVRRVTTDTGCVRDFVITVLLPLLTSVANLVVMFSIMWQLDRSLSLLAVLAAAPLPTLMRRLTPQMTERAYEHEQLQGQMMTFAEQTLTALPVVQAFGREDYEDRRFRGLSLRIVGAYLKLLLSQLWFQVTVGVPTAVGTAAMLVLGGFHVLQGSLSIGSLLVFLAYLEFLYGPMATLAYLSSGYASAAASSRRVLEILDANDLLRDAPGARPLIIPAAGKRAHVQFRNVTFGYEPGQPVLKEVTLEAAPGETLALIGPSGAGKTTLVSLLVRFFDVWDGEVRINGMNVRDVQIASLRAQVALVLQEPFLLPLTIAENIAYGRPVANRDEIVAAAVAANADEFIRRLPEGYDTLIGERGATLSGGERQRLAIARALLKDSPILILDEPTAALDAQTETLVLEALQRLMAGRTTIIIAHRMSSLRQADRIVVLEEGRVVETGTNQELLAADNLYHRYYNLQYDATSIVYRQGSEREAMA